MPSNEAGPTAVPAWRKASLCASGECVEVAQKDDVIILRDSVQPRGRMLYYDAGPWRSFVRAIKTGRYDDLGS